MINDDQVIPLFQFQGAVGSVLSLILLAPIGYMVSRLSPKILIPFAFLFRGTIVFMFS